MNSELIRMFYFAAEVNLVYLSFGVKTQVLLEKLEPERVFSEGWEKSLSEENRKVFNELLIASPKERIDLLQNEFGKIPCEKVTLLHSYIEDCGYISLTLNFPTYYQILEALISISGFNGNVTVEGDHKQGYLLIKN